MAKHKENKKYNKLIECIIYICFKYSDKEKELAESRLSGLIYLLDWQLAQITGKPVTEAVWEVDSSSYNFGSRDLFKALESEPEIFNIIKNNNSENVISLQENYNYQQHKDSPSLTPAEKKKLDKIVDKYIGYSFGEFEQVLYATYPLLLSMRLHFLLGSELDLIKFIKAEKMEKTEMKNNMSLAEKIKYYILRIRPNNYKQGQSKLIRSLIPVRASWSIPIAAK